MVGFIKTNGTSCRFVSMISETPVSDINAAGKKLFPGLVKVSRKQGMINVNYTSAVERRIAEKLGVNVKSVEYTPGKVWYKHLTIKTQVDGKEEEKPLPLCVHATKEDGEYYLQYYPTSSTNVYKLGNGDIVSEDLVKPYFYKKEKSEFKPTVISIKVSNIKRLAASGIIMQASDLDEAESALATVNQI